MLREEEIRKHRAMWNWIAKQIENHEDTMDIGVLKVNYIKNSDDDMEEMYVHRNCYLCNYTDNNCEECPLLWPSQFQSYQCEYGIRLQDDISGGLYARCWNLKFSDNWLLQAKLARAIANLTEKED